MLPKNLKYGSKVNSAAAKSSRVNIAPQNGTGPYNLTDTIYFNIPTHSNTVLVAPESYLKFTVPALKNGANNNTLRLDSCGAHGLIQRIRIFHGSNPLQDIDNYGLLCKMMFDLMVPTDAVYGKYNVMSGTRSDLVATMPTISQLALTTLGAPAPVNADINAGVNAVTASLSTENIGVAQVNSGELIKKSDGVTNVLAATNTTSEYTFCLNLVSLIGTLCPNNYLPLFALTGSPLRVEIQLVSSLNQAFNCLDTVTAPNGIMKNVEYIANFIELSDSSMSIIQESLAGSPLQFTFNDYRNYQYSYAIPLGGSTQVQMPIAAKFSSLKSLLVAVRDKGSAGTATYFPYSSVQFGLTDYTFRIGPALYPPKAPSTQQEFFCEVLKAIGSMSDTQHQPSIDKASYTLAQSVATTLANDANGSSGINSGSFYIGIDLENYTGAPKDTLFAGYNANNDDIYCTMNFVGPAAATVRFDAFAMFDSLIVFENSTAFIRN